MDGWDVRRTQNGGRVELFYHVLRLRATRVAKVGQYPNTQSPQLFLQCAMLEWTPPNAEYPPPKPGEPPLHRAARLGDHDEIRRLIASGQDINAVFNMQLDSGAWDSNATPLMVAAGSGDGASIDTVLLLLELGADPKPVLNGSSAATFALEGLGWNYRPGGDAVRFKALLQAGSPIPSQAERRNRLLCESARTGDASRVAVLLELGIDPKGHWDPEEARKRHELSRQSFEEHQEDGSEFYASMPEEMRELMRESMKATSESIFSQMESGPSDLEIPLFCAAASGSAECVDVLLRAGADIHARDNSNRTAMFSAASVPVIRTLQAAGLSLEDQDCHGWTPLDNVISDGEHAINRVRAFIEAGANVNATHDRGYTVFMSAVGSGRFPELLRLLVASGADPHAVSELGYNAFHAAIDVNFDANAEESVRDTLTYLKELGVDLELRNKYGETPLARAIHHGNGTEVRVLCEIGANPNAVCTYRECGSDDCTEVDLPLLFHIAKSCAVDQDEKMLALLRAGGDPMAKDSEGYIPLHNLLTDLFSTAPDYAAAWQSFYEGLRTLRRSSKLVLSDRETFVREATPILHQYVETFAANIPIPQICQFDQEWRQQKVTSVAHLCVFEWWAQLASQSKTNT